MAWTDAKVKLLKKLWAQGHSASVCAARINMAFSDKPVSRNATIAKVHRLGLAGRATTSRMKTAYARKPQAKKPQRMLLTYGNPAVRALYAASEPLPIPADELVIPLHERKTIVTLEDNDCRWPIGDPQILGFHFCGKEKVPGLSYCEFHARKAFVSPEAQAQYRAAQRKSRNIKEVVDA